MHRVAITGLGIVSCLGNDLPTVGAALRAGRSGLGVDPERQALGFRSPLTGLIRDFDPQRYLSRKERKTMTEFAVQAYAAVTQALAMARLEPADWRTDDTGLIFGGDSSCLAAIESADLVRQHRQTGVIGSGTIFRTMTSNVTLNLNSILGTRGASWTVSAACSSSGHAVGQAAALIAAGQQTRVICGGAQEVNWQAMCSFDALDAFSVRVQEPARASRPFDAGRDGLVPSGGAAALVLERLDAAERRGAPVLGEVLAYAFSSDGDKLSVPSDDGLRRAMTRALAQAGLRPADIDYVCAHATSTPAGDAAEARNLAAVFGSTGRRPWVSSVKSMTGHELWMSGAAQVVYTTIMAQQGFIAPNINFETPDADSAKLRLATATVNEPPRLALCNAAGFGGTNSCLALRFA